MNGENKPLVWLEGQVKTPPFSRVARIEAGTLLRRLQRGENIGMPHSRPMPSIGRSCHELRIRDEDTNWRLIYRIDSDAIIVIEMFAKKAGATPKHIIDRCKARLKAYDAFQ